MYDKITGTMKKDLDRRIKVLPKEYQVVFYEMSKYLYQFGTCDAGIPNIQVDILNMFEAGAREGKDVLDIVGEDVIGFCDSLLEAIPHHSWLDKMKSALNQNIYKKLDRKMNDGK
ncbi:DUF1048 domain-containing protein [Alkaliphilus serpentinus]|uniref:DUF1048 domain-containing protein n=1 Tax=Alkaliphilus serpentinus TaxID=1482731 RepID=A0A833HLN2_9FIRM|nr:DUF1048 domain-containing protein [Alkaliphilus serpentinus]KAB3526257.1 DUF1048 domain-containing protein [Alkaliphilus serpentinus]